MSSFHAFRRRRATGRLVFALLFTLSANGSAQSSSPQSTAEKVAATKAAAAKRDSVARADSIAKVAKAKQATAAATKSGGTKTAAKPATTVPASSTTKSAAATAKPGGAAADPKAASGSSVAKPGSTTTAAPAVGKPSSGAKPSGAKSSSGAKKKSTEGEVRHAALDDGPARALYVGASSAGLGFGTAPFVGLSLRLASPIAAATLRADIMGAHYGQTAVPFAGAPPISEQATLTHVGAALSLVFNLGSRPSMRPYLILGGGVFRFQASGQAGKNGTLANGVFASTTDVAGIGGVGLQLTPRFTVEARYVTVGDFHTLPITIGVRF